MLRRIAEDIWEVPGRVKLMPAVYLPCRMTVVRLEDGRLVLHSPVELDDRTANDIASLGDVAFVLAPNKMHHLFLETTLERFPSAQTFAAPGLADKRDDLSFDGVLGADSPEMLRDEMPHLLLEGASSWNEVVFFHRASKSLICADLVFNVHEADGWLTPWVLRTTGTWDVFAHSKLWRKQYDDIETFASSVRRMLEWPIERIVMAHGDIIDEDCKPRLEGVFEWLFSHAPPAAQRDEHKAAAS